MRRPVLLLAIATLLVAQGPVYADDLLFGGFSSYLDSLRVQARIPGLTAAVIGGDAILWEGAFGQRNVENAIATRTDAPFHLDGLTEVFTAELVLRCVEEGRLSLDDRIGQYASDATDGNATLRELLTHTSGSTDGPAFAYHPERLAPLASAIAACRGKSYRSEIRDLATRLAMTDTVPGPDALSVVPPADDFTRSDIDKYAAVLGRLATPYSVDGDGGATPSVYTPTTLTPSSGLISTVDDYAKFDLALRQGILLKPETLAAAWQAPLDKNGQPLPHGLGWFVQTYHGETIAWQFGLEENASSSLVLTVPGRGLTLVLMANSDGLEKAFSPELGDVTASPFARVFLSLFVR